MSNMQFHRIFVISYSSVEVYTFLGEETRG
jgi:hypothetical protein